MTNETAAVAAHDARHGKRKMRGDGSFGSTDGTYGASGLFQYQTGNGARLFGCRYTKLKFGDNDRSVDLNLYGPEVGYAFQF